MGDLLPDAPRVYRFTIDVLLDEMRRELKMRGDVYPRRVAAGRMSEADAARKMAMAKAVIRALEEHAPGDSFTVEAK